MVHAHAHHHPETDHHASPEAARLMRLAGYASVAVASVLLIAKLIAWWKTDSLAMLSSLTDSAFDVLMSVVNMLALRYALKPADDDHSFGHTSIEDIAGLAQCAFIVASMTLILLQSFERLSNPHIALTNPELGIGVSLLGMAMTTALVAFQTVVARRSGSLIVAADRMHYLGDILFNLGVLAAYVLSAYAGFTAADPVIAILIAIAVLWSTKPLAMRAFNNLMDKEMTEVDKARLVAIITAAPGIRGHHHLKTRYSGVKPFIQLHAEIDAGLNFREAHAIADALEHAIAEAFPGADVIIHPDPV
jgi:ferrous-iron efflux pump FieF